MTCIRTCHLPLFLVASCLLAGCAAFPNLFDSTPARPHPRADNMPSPREQAALRDGIRLYNEGEFNSAIRRLSAQEISNGSVATRVTALKYTAFSYCVTKRQAQCEHAFERAIKLDPSFDLAPGERGHPLWGPVFARAKNGR
jgi:hypothetical protein